MPQPIVLAMLTSYRRVFSHPGALAFSATGLVARLPIAAGDIGDVLPVGLPAAAWHVFSAEGARLPSRTAVPV